MNTLARLAKFNQPIRTYYFRKIKKGCECPEQPQKNNIVQEKSCTPCCFKTWKPKLRKCVVKEAENLKKTKPRRRCYPGMAKNTPPDCKTDKINPFAKKCCTGQAKPPPPKVPPPPQIEKDTLPAADWDANC